jgi:hypothetical protein
MKNVLHSRTCRRLEMQGFVSCDVESLRAIRLWLRLGPAICGVWMALGLVLQSTAALWALVPFAILGAFLPVHPFDVLYNAVIRRWTAKPPIPSYGLPRRFACLMAGLWISIIALLLGAGRTGPALAFGGFFLVGVLLNVTSDFCLGSWIFQKVRRTRAVRTTA